MEGRPEQVGAGFGSHRLVRPPKGRCWRLPRQGRPRWRSRLPTFWTNTSSPRWEARRLPSSTANTSRTSERTSSFVCELPLRVGWVLGRRLAAKVEAARQVYNACLGEALRRLGLVRQSVWFTKAKTTPRAQQGGAAGALPGGTRPPRVFGCGPAALRYPAADGQRPSASRPTLRCGGEAASRPTLRGAKAEKTWLGEHLGAHEVQTLASRAYRATNEHLLGKHGRPRFKGKGRLHSVEGKGPGSGLRWTDTNLVILGDLACKPVIDHKDVVVRHALCSRVKYARIVRRHVRCQTRWYVQLVCAGRPYRQPRHQLGIGTVGLDIGPSTLAVVAEREAMLVPFCPEVEQPAKAIRRIQRHVEGEGCAAGAAGAAGGLHLRLNRQRRAGNPGNYLPDGRVRPGPKRWRVSTRQQRAGARLAETQRRLAEGRKTAQGRQANQVLAMGDVFQMEKVSYRAFQRSFGRSVGRRAHAEVKTAHQRAAQPSAWVCSWSDCAARLKVPAAR